MVSTPPFGAPPFLLLRAETTPEAPGAPWRLFRQPTEVHIARQLDEVAEVLATAERASQQGRWGAGFLTYEAAPALDPALDAHPPRADDPLPLAWWGLFDTPPETLDAPPVPEGIPGSAVFEGVDWQPQLDRDAYGEAIDTIHRAIARGDTYQVNFTFPLEARFTQSPYALFLHLLERQPDARHAAYVDLGSAAICSVSPELFFSLDGRRIVTRPMKGTTRRGRHLTEDMRHAAALADSTKDRAENVMIVDMMRNDLGRIAEPGSVRVDRLFEVETHPTVHQLTSTVSARTDASFSELLRALFPCASITGAPKVSTSRIIRRLEAQPRGIYTGSLGYLGPKGPDGPTARFSVAIRTATVDRRTGIARYGTGGGIVWDSRAADEYEECRAKALVLRSPPPGRAPLLETLLWRPKSGYFLLGRHLERLGASAQWMGWSLDLDAIEQALQRRARAFVERQRVRLVVHRDQPIHIEATPWPCTGRLCWNLALDDRPVDSSDPRLFHKTTDRSPYDDALARARRRDPGVDEVLLWNERRELTEGTRANLALDIDGQWYTPALDCGLLPGTYRAELLARGRLREAVLGIEALQEARKILLFNALRGWIRTNFPEDTSAPPPPTKDHGTLCASDPLK